MQGLSPDSIGANSSLCTKTHFFIKKYIKFFYIKEYFFNIFVFLCKKCAYIKNKDGDSLLIIATILIVYGCLGMIFWWPESYHVLLVGVIFLIAWLVKDGVENTKL